MPGAARLKLREAAASLKALDFPFALECHVSDAAGRVDLTVRIHPELRDAMLLSQVVISDSVAIFLRKWADPGGPLAAIPYLEVEFDIDDKVWAPWFGPAVEPFVSRGPLGIYRAQRECPDLLGRGAMLSRHVLEALPTKPPSEGLLHRLSLAYDALPTMGSINHIGALDARPSAPMEGIRLIISLPRAALSTYLGDIGWRGNPDRLEYELNGLKPYTERVDFDVYLDEDSAGNAMAIYNEFRAPRPADSYLSDTLDRLSRSGYLSDAVKAAVSNWIIHTDGDIKRVMTFKLSWQNDAPAKAKLYLSRLD